MNHETEQSLRDQLEGMQKDRVRAARRCAIMFGTMSIIALIAVVYGIVWRVQTERVEELAGNNESMALNAERKALACRDELMHVMTRLDSCVNEKP